MSWRNGKAWARKAERVARAAGEKRSEAGATYENLVIGAHRARFENELAAQIRAVRLPEPTREFPFAKQWGRGWRLDFAWPEAKMAVEVQGGGWMQVDEEGHRRGAHGVGPRSRGTARNTAGRRPWDGRFCR